MQGNLSAWLVNHALIHRFLGFDYQGIETLQIKQGDWHYIAIILYVYGYNYLCCQCAYDVAPETNPLSVLRQAIHEVTPGIAVKARRVGGSTHQVPLTRI